MKCQVIVEIEGRQRASEEGGEDVISYSTTGELYKKDSCYYLVYKEGDNTGMDGATTKLKVDEGRVELKRIGPGGIKQRFQKDKLEHSLYKTPQGNFPLGVLPSKVEADLTDKGGSINLEYELKVEQETISYNQLSVVVSLLK
ncbi:uncharacterized beta-barrel protein YwiB (DUF1934 family) [Desulfitispora alkaliphila]|uniref:DUF1934 domain-containing protein n=1 Tax=Desulfitispora alkaliphila TaxID=622674 RepID=UPI003D1C1CC4